MKNTETHKQAELRQKARWLPERPRRSPGSEEALLAHRSWRGVWGKPSQRNGRDVEGSDKDRLSEGEKTPAGGLRCQEGRTRRPGRVGGRRRGQRAQAAGTLAGVERHGRAGCLGMTGTRVLHVAPGAGVPVGGAVTGGSPGEERLSNGETGQAEGQGCGRGGLASGRPWERRSPRRAGPPTGEAGRAARPGQRLLALDAGAAVSFPHLNILPSLSVRLRSK